MLDKCFTINIVAKFYFTSLKNSCKLRKILFRKHKTRTLRYESAVEKIPFSFGLVYGLWCLMPLSKIFQLVTVAYHSFPLWRYLHYSENMRVLAANNCRLHDIYLYPVHHHTDRKSNSQPLIVVIGTNSIGRYKSTTCSHPRWPLQKIKLNIF